MQGLSYFGLSMLLANMTVEFDIPCDRNTRLLNPNVPISPKLETNPEIQHPIRT
jgi:hypothetical protein